MRKIIIDFDGTLTIEADQAHLLAEASLFTLANEILDMPLGRLTAEYQATRARLKRSPHQYSWQVNGLIASYCDEGAFILNTTAMQTMLQENDTYFQAVAAAFPQPEYDPVVDCTNHLFHRHTAELPLAFHPAAKSVLSELISHPKYEPIILTNSLGDKVKRHLAALDLDNQLKVLGDTRQYEMDADCPCRFPALGAEQIWQVNEDYAIDLRRPAYYTALVEAAADGAQLAVVADTLSLPGAMPLMMGIPFFLTRTTYTPDWCQQAVAAHPWGTVLVDLADLPAALAKL